MTVVAFVTLTVLALLGWLAWQVASLLLRPVAPCERCERTGTRRGVLRSGRCRACRGSGWRYRPGAGVVYGMLGRPLPATPRGAAVMGDPL